MKLLTRSMIVAVTLASLLAGAAPASAIVGGRDATQTYSGMAAMSIFFPGLGTAACGAQLVHPRFVLTAAHCVSDQLAAPVPIAMPGANITARLGSNDRSIGGVLATGKRVYLHPDWAWGTNWPTTAVSDLALVELTRDVGAPLMPLGVRVREGDPIRLVGWGLTAFPPPPGTTLPSMLQEQDTTRQPAASCASDSAIFGVGDLCVGGAACFGDSGSPALRRLPSRHHDPARWASVGIASREVTSGVCGTTVYTNPTHGPFRTWIYTTILTRHVQPCTCPPSTTMDSAQVAQRVDWLKLRNIR